MRKISLAALLATSVMVPAGFALADDHMDHSSHSAMHHEGMSDGIHTNARINAIDGDKVNITHEPIPALGWPSMTMDMTLLPGAETNGIKAGDEAVVMLEKGADDIYAIRAIMAK